MVHNKVKSIVLPAGEDWIFHIRDRAYNYEKKYGNCSQAILKAFMDEFAIENPTLIRSAGGMFGGMMSSLTCGAISASVTVLGMFVGREKMEQGQEALYPIVGPAQTLVKRLKKKLGGSTCGELTGVDFSDLKAAAEFGASKEHELCFERTAIGAEETA